MLLSADVQIRLAVPDTVVVGHSFVLEGFVQDQRSTPQGVAEAVVNVSYDTSLMSVASSIVHGPQYSGVADFGDTSTPGLIGTVGGVSAGLDPPSNPALEYLLFSVSFQATQAGTFAFVPQLLTGSDYDLYPIAVFPVTQVDPSQVSLLGDSITITNPINHAPVGAGKTVTTLEDTGYTFAAADFGFIDPNDTPSNSLSAVKIATLPAGHLTDNGTSVASGQFVSLADINSGKLVFTPAANVNGTGCDSFTFQVQDDGGTAYGGTDLDPTPKTMSFNVTAVNDPPELSGIEAAALAYTENDPATPITATIIAGDVDNANLAGATVQIANNYQSGQDVLSFTNTATITGTWNAANGTLTLAGSDTVANYQAALRAVKYQNTSDNPSAATRTVSFKVSDGCSTATF